MTSDDDFQVTTVVLRLKRILEALRTITNPVSAVREIISLVYEVTSILREVPGDPDAIDRHALAYRQMGIALDQCGTDIGQQATAGVPAVWQGKAADAAVGALKATQDLTEQAGPAMRQAAVLLEDYADIVRQLKKDLALHRQHLSEAVNELDSLWDIGKNLFGTIWPGGDGGVIDELAKIIRAVAGAITVFETLAEAADKVRRGLRDVAGKARAGVIRSPYVSPFDAVRFASASVSGNDLNDDNGILTTAQLARAASMLEDLSAADRARMQALLDGADSDAQRAYLLKALAAGNSVDDVTKFETMIHGKSDAWLRSQLSLVDPGASDGWLRFDGHLIQQQDQTTCGSTSIMMAHAMSDPLYALSLTTDENGKPLDGDAFSQRIKAEQERIHDSSNLIWPQALGTSPWGLADEMNKNANSLGTQYDWRLVDDTYGGSVNPALDDAVGAVDAGHTVPVLIGDGYPAHYVLLVGHDGDELIFYNPSGQLTRVSEADFRDGNMSALGYSHVQGVITPS